MSAPEGYVKLARKFFATDPFWNQPRVYSRAEAWIDLIQLAAWRTHAVSIGGTVVEVKRGEFVASLRYLAARWRWSVKGVRTVLAILEKMGRIQGTGVDSLTAQNREQIRPKIGHSYLIVNYDSYQSAGHTEGTVGAQSGHSRGTVGAQNKDSKDSKDREEGKEEEGFALFGDQPGGSGKGGLQAELSWRVEQCWAAHLRAWARYREDRDGSAPSARRTPKLHPADVRKPILDALKFHDADLLGPDQRETWIQESRVRAAGMGIFLDPWCTAKARENNPEIEGSREYLEHWRPWKHQRGKPDPVVRFSELFFANKEAAHGPTN